MLAASNILGIIWHTITLIVFGALAIWFGWRTLKRAEDPALLVFKWIASAFMIWVTFWKVAPMAERNPFIGIPMAAACGLVFVVLWRHSLAALIAKPFSDLYDGGSREVDPHPVYSIAQAKRKRGYYLEAVAEIRKQLERFPEDFEGHLLLAEVQAENLNDLPAADVTIRRLCHQPGHSPRNIALALNYLADWQLKYAQDREAARQALEEIIELLPDSEMSALASQRIAHLADTEHLLAHHDLKPISLKPGVENLGLLASNRQPHAPEPEPGTQTLELVRHLQLHPLDTDAREKLALLYANHFGRLDLAADQLEQLIAHPNQPARRVVHWLNLLADLQIRHSANYDTVRQTLQRIIDLYPNSAGAEMALSRLNHLKLELKGKDKGQSVPLGTYEQNIGLKRGLPH